MLAPELCFVLTASNSAYASGLSLLKSGGTLIARALTIIGVIVGDRKDAVEMMELAKRGIVKTHFRTAKMQDLTAVFREMEAGRMTGRLVLDLRN
ncbi:hypothetical protein L1887_56334 [Cichorium endivia]|nr:hypothetical protein L1887_56334 [Cichorium endivia]